MTDKSQISIAVWVSEGERAMVKVAADHLARALSGAAGVPWTCDGVFSPDFETLLRSEAPIILTSFLPELEKMVEPWPRAEQRLRAAYAALGARGNPVFICTIFRHVGGEEESQRAKDLRIRTRRLNLLAAEISRESRAYVIDLDRVLADIGARRLQTDYRLAGAAALETAAHFMALTLLTDGLDALVPFEIQDAARAILIPLRPAIDAAYGAKAEVTPKKNLLSMGQGRRKQLVSPVVDSDQENHVGWLIRQVLHGNIGPAAALDKLVQAVRRRGLRESALLLASGLAKPIRRKH
jgi:hypothetical protein